MIAKAKTQKRLIPAAAYIRMSSGKQERSPAQQKTEIVKLAAREGCEVVEWHDDPAITGDSGPDQRPGFRAMLDAAKAGRFKVLLAYDQDRIGRFDSLDAGRWLSVLRDSGVQIITCVQGRIDLETFTGRLVFTVNQEAKKMFLVEHSGKVLRGQLENARAGGWNGGPVPFGFDRAEFDASGKMLRRLAGKDRKAADASHRVRLAPCEDDAKLAAVRYAFERFDEAKLSVRQLARELNAKGFPSPSGDGWKIGSLIKVLCNPAYCGTGRWAAVSRGKYHTVQSGDIVTATATGNGNGNGKAKTRAKPPEEAVLCKKAGVGIVSPDLFDRVQRRLEKRRHHKHADRAEYPLSGLIFCAHCGQPMHAQAVKRVVKGKRYTYARYVCSGYRDWHGDSSKNGTCGHHAVDAGLLLGFIVRKLQETFLGPGREALIAEIKAELRAAAKAGGGDAKRLDKRLGQLDAEIGRMVKAIRTTDAPELVDELNAARAERQSAQDALQRAGHLRGVEDIEAEAERLADSLWALGERLGDGDPAVLREVLSQAVARIECRWDHVQQDGRTRCPLVGGTVELWQCGPFPSLCGGEHYAGASQRESRSRVPRLWFKPWGCASPGTGTPPL